MTMNWKKKRDESKGLILIVDDNSQNLKVLSKILEAEGYSIALAMEAYQMFSFLDNELPDLILLDIMMPDMDGYTACSKIRANDLWRDIPVILLTALSGSFNLIEGYKCGALDFISKPFENIEVLTKAATYVELRKGRKAISKYMNLHQQDIAIIEEQKKLLGTMAITDEITGLMNQSFVESQIEDEMARHKRTGQIFTVAMCEIDHMHSVKEVHGTEAYHHILKEMADFLVEIKRQQDVVARWENEDFLIVMPHTDIEGAQTFAERIRNHTEKMHFSFDNRTAKVTLTIGIAEYNRMMSKGEIVKRAKEAMLGGIRTGRNNVNLDARYASL